MKIMMIRDRNVLNINWVVYLANLLAMRGHEVIIGCDTYSKLGKTGTGYDLDPRVKICNLSAKTNSKLKNIFIAIRNKVIPPYFRFKKLIKKEKPDILLSYFPTDLYNITRFQNHKAPIIQMIHCYPPVILNKILRKNFLVKPLYKRCFKKVNTFQVLMNSYKKEIDKFFEPKNIVRIANPVRQYKENELVDLDNEKKKIIYVARIEKETKRPHLLIEAFEKIAKDFPDWKVEIWGASKYKKYNEELEKYIKDHHLEKQVSLAGYSTDIEKLYRSADIHAFPSKGEGFSLAIADAMSIGLPHIGFDYAHSVNEVIIDGHNGFLAKDVDDFAQKLKKLMSDKELRIKFGKNAHEDMKAYAPEVILNQWDELFTNITKEKKS